VDKCLGVCKHAGSANLHYKTLKNRKNYKYAGGVLRGGCKNITD